MWIVGKTRYHCAIVVPNVDLAQPTNVLVVRVFS